MAIFSTIYAIFNNWNLNNVPNLSVYSLNGYQPGSRTLGIFPLARRSARKQSSAFYQARQLQVSIYITAPNRIALEQALDTLWANIQGQEGTLVIPQSGSTRQYTCTYSTFKVNNQSTGTNPTATAQGGFIDLTLTFECSDSFGYDATPTSIKNLTGQTASATAYAYTQGGSAETQVPYIQIQYASVSGAVNQSVSIGNQSTGQSILVNRTWLAGDLLVVDVKNQSVQVNGADVVFSGALPEFAVGAQNLTYADTFTTRNYGILAYVYNRWN